MRRLLPIAVVLLGACGTSPAPSATLAGNWQGSAVTAFAAQGTAYAESNVLAVSVSGDTATISGICGGYVAPTIGPGMVNATVSTIGSGTYATYMGSVTCPARRIGSCADVVFTYTTVAILAGTTNDSNDPARNGPLTLSFAAGGSSESCGRADRVVTTLIGYLQTP